MTQRKPHLILIGAPGSGKGTQSAKLLDLGYDHVSTGNLLREEVEKGSKLGGRVEQVLKDGQLVTDELVADLLKNNLELDKKPYIFDGFPRNLAQAKILENILTGYDYKCVWFKIDLELIVERIVNRRMTKDGKHIYNLKTNPPNVAGVCDVSGEALIQRPDDREDVVRDRLKVYSGNEKELLAFYRDNNSLVEINAELPANEVFEQLKSIAG